MILPLLLHTEWKFPSHGEAMSITGPQSLWGKCETCVPALGNDTISSGWERLENHFTLSEKKSLSLVKKNGLENPLWRDHILLPDRVNSKVSLLHQHKS